mgnify:CR=1 FL=1
MLFMVIEQFRNQNGKAVYRKLRDGGRGLPDGLRFVASYVSADLGRCFQLMETDDITLFQRWIAPTGIEDGDEVDLPPGRTVGRGRSVAVLHRGAVVVGLAGPRLRVQEQQESST